MRGIGARGVAIDRCAFSKQTLGELLSFREMMELLGLRRDRLLEGEEALADRGELSMSRPTALKGADGAHPEV